MKAFRKIVPWLWLAAAAILYIIFYAKNIVHFLDSDMSSEMILGKILSEKGGIVSRDWYYSTEVRVLNNQIIFAIFLTICKNWVTARILSGITLMGLFTASFWYFCKQANIGKYFPVLAGFLFLPFSRDQFDIILIGLYYIPHTAISFLTMGMILQLKREQKRPKKVILMVLLGVLSFLAGLGGPRQVLILYLPLLFTGIWAYYQRKENYGKELLTAVIPGMLGYVINLKVFNKIFVYSDFEESMHFVTPTFENLQKCLNSILNVLGYQLEEMNGASVMHAGAALLVIVGMILYYAKTRNGRRCKENTNKAEDIDETEIFVSDFALFSVILMTLVYLFTDMSHEDRYFLPLIFFVLPLLGFALKNHGWKPFSKYLVTGVVAITVLLSSLQYYKAFKDIDKTYAKREVTTFLLAENYSAGYASFWNANVITELSNGQIEMYFNSNYVSEWIDITDLQKWLQKKEHIEKRPEGKTFLLLTREEAMNCPLLRYLTIEDQVYISDEYVVYGFADFEDMAYKLSDYTYQMETEASWCVGGMFEDGKWIMPSGATTGGPHITMYPGVYKVSVKGDHLEQLSVTATADFGQISIAVIPGVVSETEACYYIEVSETKHFVEMHFTNEKDRSVSIEGVRIEKERN